MYHKLYGLDPSFLRGVFLFGYSHPQMSVSVIQNIVRRSLFLSQNFNKKKLNKFGCIKEKMLYLYIINSQTQKHINHGKFNHSLHRHL